MANPVEVTVAGKTMKALADVFEAVSVRDAGFTLSKDAIVICAVDPAHAALAEATLSIEGGPDEPREVLISMETYKQAAKPFFGDEAVRWVVEGNTLTFKVGRRRRTVALDDPRTSQAPKIPQLEWPTTVNVPAAFLRRCNKDGPDDLDIVTISIVDGSLRWFAGNDTGTDVFEDFCDLPDIDKAVKQTTMLSREYLKDILDPAASEQVVVHLGTNFPVKFEYAVSGGACRVLLAPRIIED